MKPIDEVDTTPPIKYLNLLQNGQFEHQMIPS